MKKYILTIECDVRDIQDFSAIIEDNSTVCNMLVRKSSDSWTFWGEESDEVEEMQDELDQMVSDSGSGVQIYCNIEERNFLTTH